MAKSTNSEHTEPGGSSAERPAAPSEPSSDRPGDSEDLTIEMMLRSGPHLDLVLPVDDGFTTSIKQGYREDTLFKIVLDAPTEHCQFTIDDGLIWMTSRTGE